MLGRTAFAPAAWLSPSCHSGAEGGRGLRDEVCLAENRRVCADLSRSRGGWRCWTGKGVSIWYNAVVRGDEGAVSIGDNTNVQDGVIVHADTKVGCGCTIGHRAVVHGCTIGDNTLVGMGAILLDGARIGRVIGAGALVTGGTEIPDGTLALGSPARVVRALTKEEIARNREYMLDYLNMSREARDMQEEPDGHGRESGR